MKTEGYDIGGLLKARNAIFNYIPNGHGGWSGAVVGIRGEDRATPLVGWALFSEFDDGRIVMDKGSEKVHKALGDAYRALDVLAGACGDKAVRDAVENVKVYMDSPYTDSPIPKDIRYRTIELALARANADRGNWFVSTDPEYRQVGTDLRPKEDGGKETTCLTNGMAWLNPYDGYMIRHIRKACRAMELRCWRYFKDFPKQKMQRKVVNPKSWFTGVRQKPITTPYGRLVVSYIYRSDETTGLPKVFLCRNTTGWKSTSECFPDWLFIRRPGTPDYEQWWVVDAFRIANYMNGRRSPEEAIRWFFENNVPEKFEVSSFRHWYEDNDYEARDDVDRLPILEDIE